MMQTFQGVNYHERRLGYFEANERSSESMEERSMHRAVWKAEYGNIPHGWVVHHKDGDKANNDLANLQAMAPLDHRALHPRWGRTGPMPRSSLVCVQCGDPFEAGHSYAKYCSPLCRERARPPRRT